MLLPRLYAELFVKILHGHTGAEANLRVKHFLQLLRSRGHERLLPRIVREVERTLAVKSRRSEVVLKVARETDKGKFKATVKGVLKKVGRESLAVKEEIDEGLIRGFSIEGSDFTYDASARRKLIGLYERLTVGN